MEIKKDFLLAEIELLETELKKAQTFAIQAQATISAYQMLIRRLDVQEEHKQEQDNSVS
ncbi:hypothetical protein UFOVP868_24 [uncultured Caudovirales phage]|uniref:Uncharacterized protein n=1 Tax=uncultured Caudovirales phage TaxID=2100421 RepID=A0A6J5PIS8_9CAUD|nr:hypothetical protein UFOVP868_24 [uncultured Caudovirales phage]